MCKLLDFSSFHIGSDELAYTQRSLHIHRVMLELSMHPPQINNTFLKIRICTKYFCVACMAETYGSLNLSYSLSVAVASSHFWLLINTF